MIKSLYRPKVTIAIHLRNGKQEVTDSEQEMISYKLRYGTLPSSIIKEMPIEEFNLYELKRYGRLVGQTARYTSLANDRMFIEFQFGYRYRHYYHDEIKKLVITEEYKEVDINEVSVDLLQKELGFRGYSELLFDRFEKLSEKKERENFAELLENRAGIWEEYIYVNKKPGQRTDC